MENEKTNEQQTKEKKKNKKIIGLFLITLILAAGIIIGFYIIRRGVNYLTTDNARITTTLHHITPSMPGTLERFTVRQGDYVAENQILGWVEGGESFRSPVDGVIVKTFAEQNQFVLPQIPLAVIADTRNLHIQANIEENYIARIQKGQSVIVTIDALGNRQFSGYVYEIGRVTDAAISGQVMSFTTSGRFTKVTQLLPLRINLTDDVDLSRFIGLNAAVRIRLGSARDKTIVPNADNIDNNVTKPAALSARGIVVSAERRNVYTTFGNMIRRVYAEAGDIVREGQVLGVLDADDPILTVAHQQAESALRNARAELRTREAEHQSLTHLYDIGGISRLDFRQSEDMLAFARNRYEDARTLLNAAVLNLERQMVVSPIDGVVTAVFAREGSFGPGLLFVVEDTENLRIRIRLREYDIVRIKPGMPVAIKADALENAVYTGIVNRVNPAAIINQFGETSFTPVVEFEAEIDVTSINTGLRIGMNARVMLDTF